MSDDHPSKACSECFEPMDARARCCPHCGRGQWRRTWPRFAVGFVPILVLMVIWMVIWMVWVGRMERVFSPQPLPAYAGQIKVAESRLEFGQSPEGPVVLVVGMLKNESDTAWQQIEMQAQVLRPEGRVD